MSIERTSRLAAMALALLHSAGVPAALVQPQRKRDTWGAMMGTVDTGRRAEKDAEALRKAAEKRARKEAKRAREAQP